MSHSRPSAASGLVTLAMILAFAACSSDATEPQTSFRLEVEPAKLSLIRGAADTVTVTVAGENGFDEAVTLSASAQPGAADDLSLEFDANPTMGTSGLTVVVSTGAAPDTRTITIVGSGGGGEASATLALTIEGELPGDPSEVYSPGVAGEVRTIEVDGGEFSYEVFDGVAVFQGDMVLGDAEELEERLAGGAGGDGDPSASGRQTAACGGDFGFGCARWTDGIVGYAFADDWGADSTNLMMRQRIRRAMRHWEDRTNIEFVARSGGQRVVFRDSGGCSSDVGRREITGLDPQWVSLDTDCEYGTVIHEIGHAVGLWHEQSRMDRGDYVRIDFGAVEDFRLHNFFTHAGLGVDVGDYDYGSIMHYDCRAFARDERNTIEPILAGRTCADIGQRDSLSEGDVLGAYTLYPPEYTIAGAAPAETSHRFDLAVSFDTEPVRDDYVVWRSDRVPGDLETGPTLTLRDAEVPSGGHVVTANVVISGTTVASESIELELDNSRPTVDLGADRDVDLNRIFYLTPSVADAEDGDCSPLDCDFDWSPEPESSSGATAGYRFDAVGSQSIEVVVTDGGGATDGDAITAHVVNSPPRATIAVPTDGSVFSEGRTLRVSGSATDLNEGPDPGPGDVDCTRQTWSSGDPSDEFAWSGDECRPALTLGDPGTRTVTLVATDPQGLADTAAVDVTVSTCDDNCSPDVWFVIDSPPDFDDSAFDTTFDEPGYYLRTPIQVAATVSDADSPPDNPIAYEWTAQRVCSGTSCPPAIVIGQGELTVPGSSDELEVNVVTWKPEDDVTGWSGCVTTPRAYTIAFEATDDRGATTRYEREIVLACTLI